MSALPALAPASQKPRAQETGFHAIGKLAAADLLIGRLDRGGELPLHTQVYVGLRDSIIDGRLRPGASMPSTRDLAALLSVSRNTVLAAYEQLQAEGFIKPRVGSGTYVSRSLPDSFLRPERPEGPSALVHLPEKEPPRLSIRGHRMLKAQPFREVFWRRQETFYPGLPDYDLLPMNVWRKLSDRRLAQPRPSAFGYGHPGGYGPLRTVIAEYLAASRGVRCRPEQVIVVSGSQQGIDLTTRVLIDEGEQVWIEDPGYGGARSVFQAAGADIIPVPVDQEGLLVASGEARAPKARLAYVTPSHQYPLGSTMSIKRRYELLAWAEKNDSWIIEDDYDSEFRYSGRPQPGLQGLEGGAERVIYLGTFSKVLFPSLRLGYVVVPEDLVDAFLAARAAADRHQSTLDQAILADFIAEGHFTRHVRRCRLAYAERQECMIECLEQEAGEHIQTAADPAGMSLIGWLAPGISDVQVSERLAGAGIFAPPLSYFAMEPQPNGALMLGYTGFAPPRIKFGMCKLGAAMREMSVDNRAPVERVLGWAEKPFMRNRPILRHRRDS